PGRSDVDVLAIVEEPPSDAELAAFVEAIASLRDRTPAPADVRVVARSVAAAPTPSPPMEAYVRIEPGGDPGLEVETRSPGERDLVVELSVCRSHGRNLVGPPPPELIGDVPDEWVSAVGAAVLADWQRLDYDPALGAFMVLTTCRIWRFAEEQVHCTK